MDKITSYRTLCYTHEGANGYEEVSALDVVAGCLVRTVKRWRVGAGAGQKDFSSDTTVFVPGVCIVPDKTSDFGWRLDKS